MQLHLAKEMLSLEHRIKTAENLISYFDGSRGTFIAHDPIDIGHNVNPEVHEIFGGRSEMRQFINDKILQAIQEYLQVQKARFKELEDA